MDANDFDEHELIAAARLGDQHAFHALYELHVDAVFNYAASRVGRFEAEDATAEVFFRAWVHLPSYEDRGGSLAAWLVRIARNLIASKTRRVWPVLYDHTVQRTASDGAFEDGLVTGLMGEAVVDALSQLGVRYQEVLRLRYLEDRSVPEVAGMMDLTEEGVRALCYRALKAFRARHEELGLAGAGGR